MRIAINGFGRIGRNFLRALLADRQQRSIELIAINLGPMNKEAAAYLFKYDTLLGTYQGSVTLEDDILVIDNYRFQLFTQTDPLKLNWKILEIDWVVDCSGTCTVREKASEHIQVGADKVLISAPAKGEDITIIPGVNHALFDNDKHRVVSLGSCSSNALLPMLKVLYERCGLQKAFITTVHAYTNSQVLLDAAHKDLRRSRAAAVNIIPTTTGAMNVIEKVLPDLKGKVDGRAMRVPVDNVSLMDITFVSDKSVTATSINQEFERASEDELGRILAVSHEPLVSSDYKGNSHSVTIDGLLTQGSGTMGKVFGWYDNEWAYSVRMKDFLLGINEN